MGAGQAAEVLAASWDEGVRTFDTAPKYGVGLAEERLGEFLARASADDAIVSTKVGRALVDTDEPVDGIDGFYGTPQRKWVYDYTKAGTRRSIAESLQRLKRDRVDIALIHDPEEFAVEALTQSYPALQELRDE